MAWSVFNCTISTIEYKENREGERILKYGRGPSRYSGLEKLLSRDDFQSRLWRKRSEQDFSDGVRQQAADSNLFGFVDGVGQFDVFALRQRHGNDGGQQRRDAEHEHGHVLAKILGLKSKIAILVMVVVRTPLITNEINKKTIPVLNALRKQIKRARGIYNCTKKKNIYNSGQR